MDPKETKRFDKLYQRHLQMLKLQGKSAKTRDAYARAIRRLRDHFDCCPDKLTPKQLESYFAQLVETHSWSTVKVDCWGFKFFWQFVLEKDWQWVNIVKPPKVKSLPDILTPAEIEQLIGITAIKYLSKYLYKGVIGEKNIISDKNDKVTFRYVDSETKTLKYRTLPGEDFICLILQHVLPKGFRRARDYGFLHANAKKLLSLVQLVLHVVILEVSLRTRPAFICPRCKSPMVPIGFRLKPG